MYCKLNNIDSATVKSGVLLIPRERKTKWSVYINNLEDEKKYIKIFRLLSILFQSLGSLNALE